MFVEIITVPKAELPPEAPSPFRCIVVQYPTTMKGVEEQMRAGQALFDTPVPGMTPLVRDRVEDGRYRTAVLRLAEGA